MSIKTTIPPELFDNFRKQKACFFVGAGLSIDAGFPSWNGLLDRLIEALNKRGNLSAEKMADYSSLKTDPSRFLFLAEDLKSELGNSFFDYMEEWFGDASIVPTINHELIAKIPTKLTLTINYDRLIENGFSKSNGVFPNFYTYKQSREAANSFWKEKYFVFKAHGDANSDPQGLILSQKDYRKTLYRELGYRSLLQSIFSKFSVVFLGVSLNDPEFNQLLDYLHDSYHGGGPTHYALMEESKTNDTLARRYLEEFKVQSIIYTNDKGSHEEITDFLNQVLSNLDS